MTRLVRALSMAAIGALAVTGAVWLSGLTTRGSGTSLPDQTADPTRRTAAVERRTLTVTADLDGQLRHSGDYEVLGGLSGTLTWTPPPGQVVTAGLPLFETNGAARASLMYGSRPAWRSLQAGVSNGPDIRQLEQTLKLLGYTRRGDRIDRHWDSRTTAAVKRWQRDRGLVADGKVDLGDVVFLPEPIRVTAIEAKLGSLVGPGTTILTATSNRRVVSVDLDLGDRELLERGTKADVRLPDGTITSATVVTIGPISTASSDDQATPDPSLPVTLALDDLQAVADLDDAPVR